MYNLPGINCVLRLTGPILASIYLGDITTWNDAAITKINPKCSLPSTKITPVHRSDNSGTTYNFTDYLSSVSPAWKSKLGVGVNAQWPNGPGASGSSGVSGVLTKTEGSIGYADVAYALKNKIRFASILNKSGRYATPGLRGIKAAADTLPKKLTGNGAFSIVDPPKGNPLAYPISTFTYVIVQSSSSKSAELKKMIYWAVTTGQSMGPPLLFQPLPLQVKAFAFKQIKKI
jgi:phosphate transport system substrate-binding protein